MPGDEPEAAPKLAPKPEAAAACHSLLATALARTYRFLPTVCLQQLLRALIALFHNTGPEEQRL